jgi:hypothetical protein
MFFRGFFQMTDDLLPLAWTVAGMKAVRCSEEHDCLIDGGDVTCVRAEKNWLWNAMFCDPNYVMKWISGILQGT